MATATYKIKRNGDTATVEFSSGRSESVVNVGGKLFRVGSSGLQALMSPEEAQSRLQKDPQGDPLFRGLIASGELLKNAPELDETKVNSLLRGIVQKGDRFENITNETGFGPDKISNTEFQNFLQQTEGLAETQANIPTPASGRGVTKDLDERQFIPEGSADSLQRNNSGQGSNGGIESVVIDGRRVKVGSPAYEDAIRGGVSPGISSSTRDTAQFDQGGSQGSRQGGSIGEVDLSNPADALAKISKGLQTFKEAQDAGANITGSTTVAEADQYLQTYNSYSDKFGLPDANTGQQQFSANPLETISDITSTILDQMGFGDASTELEKVTNELEDLANERDEKIRDINDDPWLTEGVRQRRVAKISAEYEDRINNRTNKLGLLQDIQSEARQASQFAIGTAVSLWDNERRFQQDQLEFYYQQSQDAFENQYKLQSLSQQNQTSAMSEYLFAVENGQFSGSFLDWKSSEAAATRAPSSGGGVSGGVTPGTIVDSEGKKVKLTGSQAETISGYNSTVDMANQVISLIDEGVSTGPIAGRALQAQKLFGKGDSKQLQTEQLLGKLKADFMKAISGAAVSDQEVIRLSKFLPSITDQENVIKTKLQSLIAGVNNQKSNLLQTLGGTEVSSGGGVTGTTSSGLNYTIK